MKNYFKLSLIVVFVFCAVSMHAQILEGFVAGSNKQGNVEIKNTNNKAIKLSTNNAQRMTIDSSGNVGINKANPNAKLDVNGLIKSSDTLEAVNIRINNVALTQGTTQDSLLSINANGNIRRIAISRVSAGSGITSDPTNNNVSVKDTISFSSSVSFNNGGRDTVNFNGVVNFKDTAFFNNNTTFNDTVRINSTLALNPLASGTINDSIVTWDPATGNLRKRTATSFATGLLTISNLTSAPMKDSIAKAVALSIASNTSNLKDTLLNTLAYNIALSPLKDSISNVAVRNLKVGNGLNKGTSNDSVLLGGTLTKATTIITSATNTLAIEGLTNTAQANDSVLVVGTDNKIKKALLPISGILGVLNIYNGDSTLSSNRNVFMQDKTIAFDTSTLFINPSTNRVGIGTMTPTTTLDVNGKLRVSDTLEVRSMKMTNTTLGVKGASNDSVILAKTNANIFRKISYADLNARIKEATIAIMPTTGMLAWVLASESLAKDTFNAVNLSTTGGFVVGTDPNELNGKSYIDLTLGGVNLSTNYTTIRTVVAAVKYDAPLDSTQSYLLGASASTNFKPSATAEFSILDTFTANANPAKGGLPDYYNTGFMTNFDPNLNTQERENAWRIIIIRTRASCIANSIGANTANTPAQLADIKVAELALFNRAISDSEVRMAANYLDQKYNISGSVAGNVGVDILQGGNFGLMPNMVLGTTDNVPLKLITNNIERMKIDNTGGIYLNNLPLVGIDAASGAVPSSGESLIAIDNSTNQLKKLNSGYNVYTSDGNLQSNRYVNLNNNYLNFYGTGAWSAYNVGISDGTNGLRPLQSSAVPISTTVYYTTSTTAGSVGMATFGEPFVLSNGTRIVDGASYQDDIILKFDGATPANAPKSCTIECFGALATWTPIATFTSAGVANYPLSLASVLTTGADMLCTRFRLIATASNDASATYSVPNLAVKGRIEQNFMYSPSGGTNPLNSDLVMSISPTGARFNNSLKFGVLSNFVNIGTATGDGVFANTADGPLGDPMIKLLGANTTRHFRIGGARMGTWFWGTDSIESNNNPGLKVLPTFTYIRNALSIGFDATPRAALDINGNALISGRIGVGGIVAPTEAIDVAGNVRGTAFINSSDARFKTNISTIDSAVEKIKSLRGVNYFLRTDSLIGGRTFSDAKRQYGLIAQEVQQVLPELVYADKEGYLSVDYTRFAALLIEVTKHQQKQIETFKKDHERMEKLIKEVEALQKK